MTSDSEMLSNGVPKVIMLFKSKTVSRMINELQAELRRTDLSEEEQLELMLKLSHLNKAKVIIARKLDRLIL